MLKTIQRFFQDHLESSDAITSKEATDHALKLATAALLIEVTRADSTVRDEERRAVTEAMQERFGLPDSETAELIALAEAEAKEATSLFQFTHLIDKGFSHEQKAHVVELLWRVVFADAEMEKHEEGLVRRVAELIHVPHKVFIDTKIRVRKEITGE